MGKSYGHQYLTANGSRHGLMRCGACGKDITEGDYRVAQKSAAYDWHYVTHHRACTESDPGWAKKDAVSKKVEQATERIQNDVKALLAKYPENQHDWIFEEIKEQLGYDE